MMFFQALNETYAFLFTQQASHATGSRLLSRSPHDENLTVEHGRHNRSGRPGDRRTNVCSLVAEKPADVISEVLNSKFSPRFGQIIGYLVLACGPLENK